MTPHLDTKRLALIPLRLEDALEMVEVMADPGLYTFIGGGPPTIEELATRFRGWVAGPHEGGEHWHNWVIRLRDADAPIGHVQATIRNGERAADIAWVVGTRWQGRGYASEAALALVDWLEATGVTSITAFVHPGNVASARVAERAGLLATDELIDGEVAWRRCRAAEP